MTKDEIIKLARVSGCHDNGEEFRFVELRYLERFAALIASRVAAAAKAEEREACARVADRHSTCKNDTPDVIAVAIRARGETTSRGQA